jgi:hypothetical protein
VHPFCLTVDVKGSGYLTRIFGRAGTWSSATPTSSPWPSSASSARSSPRGEGGPLIGCL